jgi:hypothetical protein
LIRLASRPQTLRYCTLRHYDGKPVGSVECIDTKGAELALKNMVEVFRGRNNWLPTHKRIAILERTATQNIDTTLYAFKYLAASTVMINDHTVFRVDWMSFTGLRESGYRTGGIPYTFRDIQIEKMSVIHSASL